MSAPRLLFPTILLGALALAPPAQAADIFVTTTTDGIADDGNCTLREAIRAANTDLAVDACRAGQPPPAVDVVVLEETEDPYLLTVAGVDDSTGDLDIYSSLDIAGAPSTIDATGLGDRVLDVRGGAAVSLLMVTVRGGDAGVFQGGGLYAGSGSSVLLSKSSVRGNRAGSGAGIALTGGAKVTLHDSDVTSNGAAHAILASSGILEVIDSTIADNDGTGIAALASSLTLEASTISGNSATGLYAAGSTNLTASNGTISGNGRLDLIRGGGLLVESPAAAVVYYSTIAGNTAQIGGGVNVTGTLALKGTILGANQAALAGPDCYTESTTLSTQGWNLIQRPTCAITPLASDRTGSDPKLDDLADWGGPTRTRRLLPGSPALDGGDPADFPPFDQRGEGRPRHGDADATALADLGAHENGNTIVVDSPADLAGADGKCSLRDAIRAANTDTAVDGCRAGFDRDLIWIDDAAIGDVFLALTGIDADATTGDLDVLRDADVAGLPQRTATIEGGLLERVFEVHAPARLGLSHLRLMRTPAFGAGGGAGVAVDAGAAASLYGVELDGHTSAGAGGAGVWLAGELRGEDVWIHDNGSDRSGAGISLESAEARLDLRRARISTNHSEPGTGGGIAILGGRATLVDTSVTDNTATGDGGGVHVLEGRLDLINATIAHNRADSDGTAGGSGGGIATGGGETRLWNSLVADNLAASSPDCSGSLDSRGFNLIETASCSLEPAAGDQFGVDPRLAAPLADTYATRAGSPARDSGSAQIAGSLGLSCSRIDGIGTRRPIDGGSGVTRCDIGAIESVGVATLDVDGDGTISPLTDGMLTLRYLFGFTGETLTGNAVAIGAPRSDADAIVAYLTLIDGLLDADGNNVSDGPTDGILILRFLFRITGPSLVDGVLGPGASRTSSSAVAAWLSPLVD